MVKRSQMWIGISLGLVVLAALFGAAYTLIGGDRIAIDTSALGFGDATGTTEVTTNESGDLRSLADTNGEAGANGGSIDSNNSSGRALRVVTAEDGSATTSTSAPTTSTTTAAPSSSTTTSAPAETSSTSTTAATSSSTTQVTTDSMSTTTTAAGSSSTTATTAQTTTSATVSAPPAGDARANEAQVIQLTNDARAAAGCPPLTNNDRLHNAALAHSTDMAVNDYFSHTSLDGSSMVDRIEREGYSWRRLAENIAAGYRTPQAVVNGWMNSPGHRANIENCDLTEIGVGFYDFYWTQNFGTPT